ncbi:MAG: peptidylprolyl isomerase, partial [Acidobacteriota bacterium]
MTKLIAMSLLTVLAAAPVTAEEAPAAAAADTAVAGPQVVIETSKGSITVELFEDKAPITVKNFLSYAESGFYDGTVFHRVIPGFMIQGGGYTPDLVKKDTGPGIQNEADNGLKNDRGTLAMARTSNPNSATSQFFISVVNNDFLNHTSKTPRGWGYAVFAKVVEGMDVVDAITGVPTGTKNRLRDVPQEPVTINKVTLE